MYVYVCMIEQAFQNKIINNIHMYECHETTYDAKAL